ncbi:hypothetical protein D7M11_26795 [Paenibacillus ginsengarvi]|uniref:Uncharacterized protein n=2 Tax=Paenibacillus ginsengarvi TaxID=400777 RepID=A0A3B0BRD4_9BACL|nr:hypothetical protein D7M11_26795 [Paenibacillus ginsengarvi]
MKRFLTTKAMKVALAVVIVTGISVVSVPQKTHAMDCYHWFDYYYKVTGDLDFAELGYNVCMNQR